jgi:hypothetical protein
VSGGYNNSKIDSSNSAYVGGNITVGTSEQLASATGSGNNQDRQNILIYNRSTTVTVYFGPTGVTTSTGIPISPGELATLNVGPAINVYLIAGTAGNIVTVQEVG